ncbi:MAG: class I SAM-dependent methyltransferase [Alphaproteobacteria bacterium]
MTDDDVNRWSDPAWALRYLRERDAIPHRAEGLAVLLEVLPDPVGRVLDLGTGDGSTLALVLAARPAASGVGLDFQEEMLARARRRFADDARAVVHRHDLREPLPRGIGEFDLVVSSFAIHHLPPSRQEALYGEVHEHLRPGGVFLHMEHVASPTPALHEAFLRAIGKTPAEDDPSNKLVPVPTHLAWLDAAGFREVECLWKWRELALLGATRPG